MNKEIYNCMIEKEEKQQEKLVQNESMGSELQQLIAILWCKHKIIVISSIILITSFFIPYISLLIWLIVLPLWIWGIRNIPYIKKKNKDRPKLRRLLSISILFISIYALFSIAAIAYSNSIIPFNTINSTKTVSIDNTTSPEEKNSPNLNIIANPDYDTGDDKEAQDINKTIEVNKLILGNDNNTKDTKLFTVTAVVDGDTIKVNDLGTIRLIGIDTPETKDPRKPVQCYGEEASNKAKELLDNQEVYLEFDPASRIDKYGRTLAYVYRKDGLFYNAEMVKQGYANSYTKFPHPKLEEFNQYQKESRDNNKGLWSQNTCNGDTSKAVAERLQAQINKPQKPSIPTPPNIEPITEKKQSTKSASEYIPGSCDTLNEKGLGNFPKNDPNYRLSRDRDEDGIACEMN
jgi:endonuclease YncB( thermonuclease family)